jgi:hypothetical protein
MTNTHVTPFAHHQSRHHIMLSVDGYSSGEEDIIARASRDAFSLSSIPTSENPGIEDVAPAITTAAPDVLAEVGIAVLFALQAYLTVAEPGPPSPNFTGHSAYRHANEREYPLCGYDVTSPRSQKPFWRAESLP